MRKAILLVLRTLFFDLPRMVLLAVQIIFVALVGIVLFGIPGLVLLVSLLVLGIFVREILRKTSGEKP